MLPTLHQHTCLPPCRQPLRTACGAARRGNPARQNSSFFSEAPPVDTLKNPLDRFKDAANLSKRGGRWKSDFIWNTRWKEGLEFQEAEQEARRRAEAAGPQRPVGNLGLSRVLSLDDMAQDLSEQLRKRETSAAPQQEPQPLRLRRPAKSGSVKATQGEQRKWDRQASYLRVAKSRQQATQEAPQSDYDALKSDLQGLTFTCVLVGTALASFFYSKEIAGSYAAGGLAGFTYLRLLQRSVDSVGAPVMSPQAIVGGALSNNRMLIPFLLALAYNRWNVVAAPQVHLQAQLMPMLLGFFTYKAAVLARGSVSILGEMTSGRQQQQQLKTAEHPQAAEQQQLQEAEQQPRPEPQYQQQQGSAGLLQGH